MHHHATRSSTVLLVAAAMAASPSGAWAQGSALETQPPGVAPGAVAEGEPEAEPEAEPQAEPEGEPEAAPAPGAEPAEGPPPVVTTPAPYVAAPGAREEPLAAPPTAPEPTPVAQLPPGTVQVGGFQFRPLLEVRERLEINVGRPNAGSAAPDQYFVGSRARLGLDARYEGVRLLVQVADARSFGQVDLGVDDGATTGLHQGFMELAFRGGWLRVGRQEVDLGRQRMIGSLNWATAGRSFDAMRLHASFGASELDALAAVTRWVSTVTQPEPTDAAVTLTDRSEGAYLAAIHYAWAAFEAFRLDAYVLFRHDGGVDGNIDRQRDIAAPGLRLHGQPVAGLTYEAELVFQAGNVSDDAFASGDDTHLAVAAAVEAGYVVQVPFRPGVAAGFSYASSGSGDDALREFDNFFPTNHGFYGAADLFSWRNLIHGFLTLTASPQGAPVRLSVANHVFFLADPDERWANAGGGTVGVSRTNEERLLGYELDLNVALPIRRWLAVSFGYSVFVPLGAAAALIPGPDPASPVEPAANHWGYLMIGSTLP